MRTPSQTWILERLQKSMDAAGLLAGRTFTAGDVMSLVSAVASACTSGKHASKRAVSAAYQSLSHMVGREIGAGMLKANVHRLVANWHVVLDGVPIPEWEGELRSADVVFTGMYRRQEVVNGRLTYRVRIRMLTGITAGMSIDASVTDGAVMRFLKHIAGVSRYDTMCEDLSGMCGQLSFYMPSTRFIIREWGATEHARKHNRALMDARSDIAKCPAGVPCMMCGKTIDQCPLAVWLPEPVKDKDKGDSNGKQ